MVPTTLRAGAPAVIFGLASKPELNGTRVTIGQWIEERQRWRCKRKNTAEALGVRAANLHREDEDALPSPIVEAASLDDRECVVAWLESGGDIDARGRSSTNDPGDTLLMLASAAGHDDLVVQLLRRGADVNGRSDTGGTALMSALPHPSIVRQLLQAGAHTHLRWVGPSRGATEFVCGTALDNAEHRGLAEAAALIRQNASGPDAAVGVANRRDGFELERDVLMKVLAATLLPQQAMMGDAKAAERRAWMQQLIESAFADPDDSASLSLRFTRHGDERYGVDIWVRAAHNDANVLARQPRFKELSSEISDQVPGLHEHLQKMVALS